jgi:Cu2+-exporting ATPase
MADETAQQCFHCGLPVASGVELAVTLEGVAQPMCCRGCQAVAQAIVDGGLSSYYATRNAMPESPSQTVPAVLSELAVFDHAAYQASFVRQLGDDEREASLMLEGITCAACVWLNEQHLARLAGVTGVQINYATRRARVRWDTRRLKLSDILAAVEEIGYHAHPYDPARHEAMAERERRSALWRLFVAGFGSMQVMMYAWPAYIAGDGDMAPEFLALMRWASLFLTLPVVFYSSAPFFKNAWRDIRIGRAGMDVTVALGVAVAFLASVWATFSGKGEVYYDSVAMFVFFLLGGRFLEMRARQGAVAATEAVSRMRPVLAHRIRAGGGTETVAAAELKVGDRVLVKLGELVPADGVIVGGRSALDEAFLTGESLPVTKGVGDMALGGSTNSGDVLQVEVKRTGESTRLSTILQLMERAAIERPQLVVLADRVASWFVAAILVIAVLTWLGWWWLEPLRALPIVVAVLVVTCPCALALATPTALTVATGRLAREGFLISRGHVVETLARVSHVVLDKTGTLTLGRLSIDQELMLDEASHEVCRAAAAALEANSEHPIGRAFAVPSSLPEIGQVSVTAGAGVEGVVGGQRLRIGRGDYVAALVGTPVPEEAVAMVADGGTLVLLGGELGWLAAYRLSDPLRPNLVPMISALKRAGIKLSILSGDAPPEVARVARLLGVEHWQGAMLPQDKLAKVSAFQQGGAVVAMVGDGINDGPVLARADVSVAMGAGADLTKVRADCVLLSERLPVLADAVTVCRRTMRIVRQNLFWSLAYNGLAVPLAVAGMVTPWLAGLGMSGSSLFVVMNALRLRRS